MNEKELRRLSDCEVLLNKYHDKLTKYMEKCDNYAKNVVSFEQYVQDTSNFDKLIIGSLKQIEASKLEIEKLVRSYDQLRSDIFNEMRQKMSEIPELKSDVVELELADKSSKEKLREYGMKIEILNKYSNKIFDELKKAEDFQHRSIITASRHEHELCDFKKLVMENLQDLLKIKEEFSMYKKSNDQLIANINLALVDMKEFMMHQRNVSQLEVRDAERKVNQRIDSLPKYEPVESLNLDEVKQFMNSFRDQITEQFKGHFIDIENAILKSNNNEMQLKIQEKKLENLSLQFKNRLG